MVSRSIAIALCVGFLAVALMATPAVKSVGAAVAADPVTMYVGYVQTPDTLNIFSMTLSISYTINFLVYDTLNSIEPDLSSGPQLAQSWEHNSEGTEWTFHLVEDAYWHDGEKVTAEDVEFSLELVKDNPEECALWCGYVEDFVDISCPDGVDGYTVKITTSVPKATMLSIMVPILPEHIWSAIPVSDLTTVDPFDDEYFPEGKPIGSGPLMLDSYDAVRGVVTFSKFADYYIDTVKVDEVIFQVFKTDDAMMTALYSGDIDVAAGVPARVWDQTLDTESIDGQKVKSMSIFELGINCAPEWMRTSADFPSASDNLETTNLSVRQAIAYAVDKSEIVDEILKGLAEEGSTLIPTATSFWHYDVTDEEEFEFNPQAAMDLLDAAGYVDSDTDGVRENSTSGVELSFSLYYRQEKVDDGLAAGKIKDWLADVGIEVDLNGVTEMSLYTIWYQCKYDLYIWAWDFDVDPSFALSVLTTDEIPEDQNDYTAWSDAFYTNPDYDEMYIDQQNTPDPVERQTIIHEMQRILYRDCPYIVLWYPFGLYAYRTDRFTNFPDMESNPGITPGTMWFYFEVTPIGIGENAPPTDADAGDDVTVYVGDTASFTGNATDLNDGTSTLEWSWVFEEPTDQVVTLDGRTVTYTFENEGNVTVTMTVTDPGGLSDTDSLVVTVIPLTGNEGYVEGYVLDTDGMAIAGATVVVGSSSGGTDENGHYNVTMPEGTYDMEASAAGYTSVEDEVVVSANLTSWMNFTLVPTTGTVTGHVYDSVDGSPIEYATVVIVLTSENKTAQTNNDGMFELEYIPPGVFTLNVSANGYDSIETEVTVVAGETTEVDLDLKVTTVEDDGGGLSTAAIGGIVALVVVAAAVAAVLLMKRKKKGDDMPPPPTQ